MRHPRINICIEQDDKEYLEQLAELDGRSLSNYVRLLIKKVLHDDGGL
jgi:uncharacterized protein (DUF1778 family)